MVWLKSIVFTVIFPGIVLGLAPQGALGTPAPVDVDRFALIGGWARADLTRSALRTPKNAADVVHLRDVGRALSGPPIPWHT